MTKLRELERRLADEPDNLGVRVMLAAALREAGRHGDAVELYRSVAMAYRDQGRTQQAIAVCRSILELAPDDALCLALLATLQGAAPGGGALGGDRAIGAGAAAGGPGAPASTGSAPHLPPPPQAPLGSARSRSPSGMPLPATPMPGLGSAGAPPRPRVVVPAVARARPPSVPDETPLPAPVPYHVADPTAQQARLSDPGLASADAASTRPGSEDGGPARATRRLSDSPGSARRASDVLDELEVTEEDLAEALVTRQRPRVESSQLEKLLALDAVPADGEDEQTRPRELPMGVRAASGSGAPTGAISRLPLAPPPLAPPSPRDPLGFALFAPLPAEQRPVVLARFARRAVTGGTAVIRRGELGHPLVLVAAGKLAVRAERGDGQLVELGVIGPGEHVGEGALLARAAAPAHAVAVVDSELLLLAPHDFYELAAAYPALWAVLRDAAERRAREHEARMRRG